MCCLENIIRINLPSFYFEDTKPSSFKSSSNAPKLLHQVRNSEIEAVKIESLPENEPAVNLAQIEPSPIFKKEVFENTTNRRESTDNDDSYSDRMSKNSSSPPKTTDCSSTPNSPERAISAVPKNDENSQGENFEIEEDVLPKDDADFFYKTPRKQKFEYNKRKDVILKTILRKCRRVLQDEFNDLTDYFTNRKMQGHQFYKDCVMKFFGTIEVKPEQLDLVFYLAAILYPQEMSRGVDCFFDCDKKERVKQRKFYRAKIQKVHDVLYRYSHERMDYFVNVPELSYIFCLFYKKEQQEPTEDKYFMNGATEIFERCRSTLEQIGVAI